MPEFAYEAVGRTGARDTGVLTANSERDAAVQLDGRGLCPVRITPVVSKHAPSTGKKVKPRVMATFYAQLADLLNSGVPLLRSLEILTKQDAHPVLTEVLKELRTKVADGTSLADSMRSYPNVFNELSVSMVMAGQEGGFLEDVLHRIAEFTEAQEELKAKVVGALAYPVFLAGAGFLVLNGLIIFFVPQFEPIFDKLKSNGELPTITIWLLAVSHFMQGYWYLIVGMFFGAIWLYRRWVRSEAGRYRMDRIRLKLPGFGKLHLSLCLSRFTRILGTMLRNGIPILKALEISKDSAGNKVLSNAIHESAENITAGQRLADPFRRCKYFPHDVVEMIAVGEESNSLEKVLVDIANGLERRTARQLELFVRLLEPVMLLVMAAVILAVVIALLLPIFKMSSAVSS
ncbi:type II secretion system F family protein [Telmatocola sphagniphila]|uniref:General secretion pathway protein F n=1 Tax=Telmatocola sphagniphila TaxID=1123043 RepID=A0A8E6BAP6_9BACT|nr:type II secretion system F family protein [Telmatocola sphagniphila]QVL34374.1 type II secretion system F family protein [Telmatocola sphagniphila]